MRTCMHIGPIYVRAGACRYIGHIRVRACLCVCACGYMSGCVDGSMDCMCVLVSVFSKKNKTQMGISECVKCWPP